MQYTFQSHIMSDGALPFLLLFLLFLLLSTDLIFTPGLINAQGFHYGPYMSHIPVWYWYTVWPSPLVHILLDSLYYDTGALYYNSAQNPPEDFFLLGSRQFTPFLPTSMVNAYNRARIPVYPYIESLYWTTFPYTPSKNSLIPYKRFEYPAYVYSSPFFYQQWVGMQ